MISISQDLLSINPAFNDSIIIFSSNTILEPERANIKVGEHTFTAEPYNEMFHFNFRGIATTLINQNKFADTIFPNVASIVSYNDSSLSRTFDVQLEIFNAAGEIDTITKQYTFLRSAEQLPFYNQKLTHANNVRVLLPSNNFTDYYAVWTEGYPFDVGVYGIKTGDTYYLKNTRTGDQMPALTATDNEVKRIFFSDGENDFNNANVLPITNNLNELELYVNGIFKANIHLKRKENTCGVYLKFVNNDGAYSYVHFSKIYTSSLKTRSMDEFNSSYGNLQDLIGGSIILGKEGQESLRLSTIIQDRDKRYFKDLLTSPRVQMYIHNKPYFKTNPFAFIDVVLNDGSYTIENTKSHNLKFDVTITLPKENTLNL